MIRHFKKNVKGHDEHYSKLLYCKASRGKFLIHVHFECQDSLEVTQKLKNESLNYERIHIEADTVLLFMRG